MKIFHSLHILELSFSTLFVVCVTLKRSIPGALFSILFYFILFYFIFLFSVVNSISKRLGSGMCLILQCVFCFLQGQYFCNFLQNCSHLLNMLPPGGTFRKLSSDTVFFVCSQTFTLFRLRKTAMPVEIYRYSFHVFVCVCPFVISSIPGKSIHFPFP